MTWGVKEPGPLDGLRLVVQQRQQIAITEQVQAILETWVEAQIPLLEQRVTEILDDEIYDIVYTTLGYRKNYSGKWEIDTNRNRPSVLLEGIEGTVREKAKAQITAMLGAQDDVAFTAEQSETLLREYRNQVWKTAQALAIQRAEADARTIVNAVLEQIEVTP